MRENRLDREFLGQGLAFPLQVNPRGEIALARGERDIEQSIRIILGTVPGERVMRPEFGCRAHELLFEPRNAATAGMMVEYVEQALRRWEPRIQVQKVRVTNAPRQDGAMLVEISYQIKPTHDERSIVYPFFLVGEE
ncbi:MAG: phage baseplate protein [Anaerolineaceae bacterium 4572_32.1]|nr:MAG: phage baseplate protein [Anaerolineaceae bacterium 4572_32.1]